MSSCLVDCKTAAIGQAFIRLSSWFSDCHPGSSGCHPERSEGSSRRRSKRPIAKDTRFFAALRMTNLARPVDTRPSSNKFKGLRVLRFSADHPRAIARRTARRLLWARSIAARDGVPMQWNGAGRDTGCRRSRKATQDNQTPVPSEARDVLFRDRRAMGPLSCCSGECTRRWRMDTGPDVGRQVHPRLC